MRCSCSGLVVGFLTMFGWAGVGRIGAHGESPEIVLFGFSHTWRFNQSVPYPDKEWTLASFDDSALPDGAGVLAFETNNVFVTSRTNTVLALGQLTYYFRTTFLFTNDVAGASLVVSNIIDDGAVFYLNGVELHRLYLPAAPAVISANTLATSHEPSAFDVIRLSGPLVETNLIVGTNILAVEVH